MVNPASIQPIAPVRVPVPRRDRSYVHELKFDGFRGVVCIGDGRARRVQQARVPVRPVRPLGRRRRRCTRRPRPRSSMARSSASTRTAGQTLPRSCHGAARRSMRRSTCWRWTARTFGHCRCSSGSAGCAASFDTTDPRCGTCRMCGAMAWTSSGRPARSTWRASCRSRPTRRTSASRARGGRR